MDVPVSSLRAELAGWIEKVRAGEEVVVTERGTPVARLVPVDTAPLLEQLAAQGVLGPAQRGDRPRARGADRVRASGSVAALVEESRG